MLEILVSASLASLAIGILAQEFRLKTKVARLSESLKAEKDRAQCFSDALDSRSAELAEKNACLVSQDEQIASLGAQVAQLNESRLDPAILKSLSSSLAILNARAKREAEAERVRVAERERIRGHRLKQAAPAEKPDSAALAARNQAAGLIAPGALRLPQDHPKKKE